MILISERDDSNAGFRKFNVTKLRQHLRYIFAFKSSVFVILSNLKINLYGNLIYTFSNNSKKDVRENRLGELGLEINKYVEEEETNRRLYHLW